MRFEEYRINSVLKTNLSKLNFKRPTDIQFKAIPSILKGEDVLAIAQTGTGKTAAFAIPVLHMLYDRKQRSKKEGIRCVVMVPTRELAFQITEVFHQLSRNLRLRIMSVVGGVDQEPQIEQLKRGVDILVTTPGRMFDLSSQGYIKRDSVEILVLDEADHMLDLGFIKDIRDTIKYLPKNRQTLFFSATIDEKIKKLAYSLVKNPIRIQISPKDPVSKNVTHSVVHIEMEDKRFFLERIVRENPETKVLVFVRTKVRAERVCAAMARVNIEAKTIHGGKEQEDRLEVLNAFREGEVKVLIATDVSARGIDIQGVEYVVNYDIPEQPENYVHRVGRTGRGKEKGLAVAFCSPKEKELLAGIENYTGNKITVTEIDKDDYQDTLDFTEDVDDNWKLLLKEDEVSKTKRRKKKK